MNISTSVVLLDLKAEMGLKEIIAAECVSLCFSFLKVKLISEEMIIIRLVLFPLKSAGEIRYGKVLSQCVVN